MAHRNMPDSFKLNPWSGVKGAASSIFRVDYEDTEILPVAEYAIRELADIRYPLVKSDNFALVNVFNPDTRHSCGYATRPHEDLIKPMTGLVLTFQMMPRPFRSTPDKVYTNQFDDFTMLWGRTLRELTSCLTISVPKSITKHINLKINHTEDLQYVYNLLGILTKNFVEYPTYANRIGKPYLEPKSDEDTLYSKYFQATLQTTFKTVSREYWPYNKSIWEEAPSLIGTDHINDTFHSYFVLHLLPYVSTEHGDAGRYLQSTDKGNLKEYLVRGINDFMTVVRSKNVGMPSKAMYSAMHLMAKSYDFNGFGKADRYDLVSAMLMKLYQNLDLDELYKNKLSSTFSSHSGVVEKLLYPDSKFSDQLQELFS